MPLHVRVCLQVWGRNLGLAQAWFFLGHVPSDNLYYFTSRTIFQASGKKADFMSKTESFVRAFGRPERILGVERWAAISSETFGKLKGGAAIWRHSLVMLAYTAPDKMVVSSNDVKRSFSTKECLMKIQEYEKIRNIVVQMANARGQSLQPWVLGEFDCACAAVVLDKKHKDWPLQFDSLKAVGNWFAERLSQKTESEVPKPFDEPKPNGVLKQGNLAEARVGRLIRGAGGGWQSCRHVGPVRQRVFSRDESCGQDI